MNRSDRISERIGPENRLSGEISPYLLQHKGNPVDWYPWGEAALAAAGAADKPILLSVGYAACHWCHVMAHESFEDPEIAALMNAHFINIKVDREERPDLDLIYQQALALLGQPGGWPLTMFLTPRAQPFWGGTYFPKEPRWGRPGFGDVLKLVAATYAQDRGRVDRNVAAIDQAMRELAKAKPGGAISRDSLDEIARRLLQEVDFEKGGIGRAPKFPQFPLLGQFWRAYRRIGDPAFREAVTVSLRAMLQGGIYDHLGGGLARYSVDEDWLVPHFEKMLYDNAELIALAALVWPETRDPLLAVRVEETIAWLAREMRAAPDAAGNRAFAASLDADSDGEEGKYYVWEAAEIAAALGAEAEFFGAHYDVTPEGNWEGRVILNRSRRPEIADAETEARLAAARAILLARRETRIRPGWDDKVLADWNGLAIAALAEAAQVFAREDWLDLARSAFAFVMANLVHEGRLRHAWRQGRAAHPASIDDLAHMAQAAIALFVATGHDDYLTEARRLVAIADRYHWDEAAGGYFFAAADTQDLVIRTKSAADQATPSGNGAMLAVLAHLFGFTGDAAYRDRAEALIAAFAGEIERNVFPLSTFLNAQEFWQEGLDIVVIGDRRRAETQALLAAIWGLSLPHRRLLVLPPGVALPLGHPAFGKQAIGGKATVYICRAGVCGLPIADPAALVTALDPTAKARQAR